MTNSRIFFFVCLSFIGGIFINSFFTLHLFIIAAALILGILLISVPPSLSLRKKAGFVVFGFCLLFLMGGVWYHQQAVSQIYYPEEQNVTFSAKVVQEPDVRETNLKLTVKTEEIPGRVLVTVDKYPQYQYGDKLKIKGFLKTPQEFEDFNYKDYLAKDGIYSVMYYPKIELLERENYRGLISVIYARILSLKDKLREVIYQNLSPPESSILAAMILGDKRQISQEWKEKLNYAGLRHLTAISGMHVAVLTVILMSFLIGLGFWRQQAFYLSIILLFLFILMTGLQSSAIRAGIMGGLFLFAQYLGRINVSSRAIVFAATLMLVHNPLLLRLDVGFQLSFLAMMGIIYLLPIFQQLLHKVPDFFELKNILAMTLSAQVFTLPLLIYNFGYFSAVAPLSNILIVPLLPFIMGLGFIFVLLGGVWNYLGWFFSLPVWFLLTYLIKITDWFSAFSFSAFVLEISWFWLLIFYLMVGVFVYYFKKKEKLKFLNY